MHHPSAQVVSYNLKTIKLPPKKVQYFLWVTMTSKKLHLTVTIAGLIISEGLYFNLDQKPRFRKVLDLVINVSKWYQSPNRNIISKYLYDGKYDQNMESNLSLIKKESHIFGLLFLGNIAIISIIPLLDILVSRKKYSSSCIRIF